MPQSVQHAWQIRKPAISSRKGLVASQHYLASAVGAEILQQGGNAIDAAIAANAMQGLTEPASCGIGGDLFVILWDAKAKKLHGLNASGRSPRSLTLEHFQKQKLKQNLSNQKTKHQRNHKKQK